MNYNLTKLLERVLTNWPEFYNKVHFSVSLVEMKLMVVFCGNISISKHLRTRQDLISPTLVPVVTVRLKRKYFNPFKRVSILLLLFVHPVNVRVCPSVYPSVWTMSAWSSFHQPICQCVNKYFRPSQYLFQH